MRSKLQKRTMVFFAVLILLASVLSGLAIYHHYWGMEAYLTQQEGADPATAAAGSNAGKLVDEEHDDVEDSIMAIAVMLVGILVIFMIFLRVRVITPLHRLEELSSRMVDGKLDQLAQANPSANCYFEAIGENVNSLAMNLQEILLLVWNLCENNQAVVEKTLALLDDKDDIPVEQVRQNLKEIEKEMQLIQALPQQFELFDVILKGKRALTKENS